MLNPAPKILILLAVFAIVLAKAFGGELPVKSGDAEDFKPEDVMDIEKVATNPRMKKVHKACVSVPNFDKLKLDKYHWLSTMQNISQSGHRPCAKALIKNFGMNATDRHHQQYKRWSNGGRGGYPGQPGQPGGR